MNDLLKALYDTFYKPPKMTETLSEIKSIHQQLVEQLDILTLLWKVRSLVKRKQLNGP